jgi:hypothetical protein
MRMPELPVEPVVRADVGIGPYGEGPEDEDRIHELVQIADRKTKPEWVGPPAELMPDEEADAEANAWYEHGMALYTAFEGLSPDELPWGREEDGAK